jgi:hypothetical protein
LVGLKLISQAPGPIFDAIAVIDKQVCYFVRVLVVAVPCQIVFFFAQFPSFDFPHNKAFLPWIRQGAVYLFTYPLGNPKRRIDNLAKLA